MNVILYSLHKAYGEGTTVSLWQWKGSESLRSRRIDLLGASGLQLLSRSVCCFCKLIKCSNHVSSYIFHTIRSVPKLECRGCRQINNKVGSIICKALSLGATIIFVMFVWPPAWNNLASTGRIFREFYIWIFTKIGRENSSVIKNDG
jgi:hypothetical protein